MRDYDPTTGRYIQADPLGLVDGASVYGYALQNPGRYVDPRGEEGEDTSTGPIKPEKPKKYVKPQNPNQRKGAEDRGKTGNRERNMAHPEGEEHSRRPKGGFRFRLPFPFLMIDPSLIDPCGPNHFGPCVVACTGDKDGIFDWTAS